MKTKPNRQKAQSHQTPDLGPEPSFTEGDSLLFLYPKYPFHSIAGPLEPHFVTVDRIRDLVLDPLDPIVVERQPLLLRGRYLLIGIHCDTGGRSEFYLDHMQCTVKATPSPGYSIHSDQAIVADTV
jgi:hypothetical protein